MELEVRYGAEDRLVFLGDRREREKEREGGREGRREGEGGRRTYRKFLRWTAFVLAKLEAKY